MVPPHSDQVSRVWPYSGINPIFLSSLSTGLSPSIAFHSRKFRLMKEKTLIHPNPREQALWFRLLPFRSPLLRKSRLIFFPLLTEMFQFGRYCLLILCVQIENSRTWFHWVSPFGDLRIKASFSLPEAYRKYTSFIAY